MYKIQKRNTITVGGEGNLVFDTDDRSFGGSFIGNFCFDFGGGGNARVGAVNGGVLDFNRCLVFMADIAGLHGVDGQNDCATKIDLVLLYFFGEGNFLFLFGTGGEALVRLLFVFIR